MSRAGWWMGCFGAVGLSLGGMGTGCRPTIEDPGGSSNTGSTGTSTGGASNTSSTSTGTGGSSSAGGQGGESLCGPGTVECTGVCVDPKVDPANCGACDKVCGSANATAFCSGAACALACHAGFADCNGMDADGCETNLATDTQNCGTCGNVCASGVPCSGGTCLTGCAAATVGNCTLGATNDGGAAMGTCAGGYSGSCSFSCSKGTWVQVSDTCGKVVSTLDFQNQKGYMLSNLACGGDCNLGSTDPQQASYVCVAAGYSTALSYVVQTDTFYPCWCVASGNQINGDCCANNPGIPTSQMITSVTCQ